MNVTATRTGSWNAAPAYLENQNSGANSSPALRVVDNGNAAYGALSVSTQGTGLIAQFGNSSSFVSQLDVNGNWSATSFNPTSDRNAKENFAPVNPQEVLEKLTALPISRWNFKQEAGTTHMGPMAQDFHAAFGVGLDDRHIATVDADGVALAAIQGLNQKLHEKESELAEMKARLARLERLLDERK